LITRKRPPNAQTARQTIPTVQARPLATSHVVAPREPWKASRCGSRRESNLILDPAASTLNRRLRANPHLHYANSAHFDHPSNHRGSADARYYSVRSALIGKVAAARPAGMIAAKNAHPASDPAPSVRAEGSQNDTP